MHAHAYIKIWLRNYSGHNVVYLYTYRSFIMAHRKAYDNHVENLVKCLPMEDAHFITTLSAQKLLPGDNENKIEKLSTQAEKASYFLKHVIKPALDIDETSDFEKLLIIMQNCGYNHVQKLAGTIKLEIDNSNETRPPVSGMYVLTYVSSLNIYIRTYVCATSSCIYMYNECLLCTCVHKYKNKTKIYI